MIRLLGIIWFFVVISSSAFAEDYIIEGWIPKETLESLGGKVKNRMRHLDAIVADLPASALEQLKNRFDIQVHKDIQMQIVAKRPLLKLPFKLPRPTYSLQQTPWGIHAIYADSDSVKTSLRGKGAVVCVIDTGIDKTHIDLAANIIGGRNFIVIKGKIDPTNWNDDNGHGSHVAGIIAALDNSIGTVGVAPQAKLFAVKALDKNGFGSLSKVTDGIYECLAQGAHVINMSLGATSDPNLDSPLKTAVETAAARGVYVVVAAGNSGTSINNTIPAGYPESIAVAAVDKYLQFPSWSNYDLTLADFSAPGVSIYSTWKGGGYNTISGTSMAAPHVAGVAALAVAQGIMTLAADPIANVEISRQGAGLINALKTLFP